MNCNCGRCNYAKRFEGFQLVLVAIQGFLNPNSPPSVGCHYNEDLNSMPIETLGTTLIMFLDYYYNISQEAWFSVYCNLDVFFYKSFYCHNVYSNCMEG